MNLEYQIVLIQQFEGLKFFISLKLFKNESNNNVKQKKLS